MAKTETTVKGYVYTVTSPNGGTVTDAEGKLNKPVDAGDQITVTAPSDALTCDDDDVVICKVNFKSPLLALRLLGQGTNALPAGYTRLEFLESTGSQCIKFPYPRSNELGCRVTYIDKSANVDVSIVSCVRNNRDDDRFYAPYCHDNTAMVGWGSLLTLGTYNNVGQFTEAKLNYKNDRKYLMRFGEVELKGDLTADIKQGTTQNLECLVYTNKGINYTGFAYAKIFAVDISVGVKQVASCRPCINSAGAVCLYDVIMRTDYKNAGSGQFVAGVGTVAQLTALLRNLPATGGALTLSLPAEANTPEVADMLQACHDTKGWTLTVKEYRPSAAATYSLRRVREVVCCRRELSDLGSYVDPHGYRWQIEWCAAIFGPHGQDPTAYGYTPFDSVDDAAAHWELVPYVAPNAEELTT